MTKRNRLYVVLSLLLMSTSSLLAQDGSAVSDNSKRPGVQAAYADYWSTVKTLQDEHNARLAEINTEYREAMKAFSEENVRRSQALTDASLSAHRELAQKKLTTSEKQAESRRIQAEDRQRRKEHALWRDTTSRDLQQGYQVNRQSEMDAHNARIKETLAVRQGILAQTRIVNSPAGAIGAAPGAADRNPDQNTAPSTSRSPSVQPEGGPPDVLAGDRTGGGADAGAPSGKPPTPFADGKYDGIVGPTGGGSSSVDAPIRDESGDNYVWSDGSRAPAVGRDGEPGTVNSKGDVIYGDGVTVVHTGDDEFTVHRPDGSSTTHTRDESGQWRPTERRSAEDYPTGGDDVDAPVRDDSGGYFEWGDGVRVPSEGQGGRGEINNKGDVVYPDGTTIVHTGPRQVTVHRPDGSSRTRRANEDGSWTLVSATKPFVEGKGSDAKYTSGAGGSSESGSASGSSGGGSGGGSGGSSGGSSGGDSDSSSDDGKGSSSDSDGGSNDDSDSSSGESSGNDSSESGSAEGGDDAGKDGKGTEYFGESGGGRQTGPSGVVQGIVDRATGQDTDVQTGVPQPCADSGGFGVTQPGPGGSGSCIPGHLPTVSEENDEQPDTPDAGTSADAEDVRRAGANDISGRITQPGLDEDGILIEDLPSGSAFDQSPVVNPPQN